MIKNKFKQFGINAEALRRIVLFLGVATILLPLLSGTRGFGQVTGTILGTVTDPTGAPVANATITATNKSTGFARKNKTGTAGDYTIRLLPVGTYEVNAESTGFKTAIHPEVILQVAADQRVDFKLELGAISEEVTVRAEPTVVQTDSATLGEVVSDQQIERLPLNGRNFMQLTLLAPGLTDPPNDYRHTNQGVAPSANGVRSEYNSYLLDGTSNTEHFNGDVTIVPP